jgi:hypothetical protein
MGKVEFRSQRVELSATDRLAFEYFKNLNNLRELMPEQVINWQSTEDSCAFDIKGMAHINLSLGECIPDRQIVIVSGPETPIELEIRINMEKLGERQTSAWIELAAGLSPMLQMFASQPLQNLVNIMAEKMRVIRF